MSDRSIYKDPLSVMLSAIHLNVDIYVNAQFCGGWLLGHKTGEKSFHLVSHGECLLTMEGEQPQVLHTGDLIIFMRAVKHQLSAIEQTQCDIERLDYDEGIREGTTGILCGSFIYENATAENILNALPSVLIVKQDKQTQKWVAPLVKLIQLESCDPGLGSDLILQQLTESLLIHSIRSYLKNGEFEMGILKLIADKKLSKALQAIQNEPESAWTVEQLAQESAMSRTAFATQFKRVSGWSPMEYLTWWRMQKAWALLAEGESVMAVAEKVGYRSESAFSRAFKKAFNVGPGEQRKQTQAE
jgi:AraC-like DNA-binding protein